jgi:hypothetical protein
MNRLGIGFMLIVILTGFNVYKNQERYSGNIVSDMYGFSFSYPGNMMVMEAGFPDYASGASDFSGRVQATSFIEERIEQILVIWTVVREYGELNEELMKVVDDLNGNSNISINYLSEIETLEFNNCTYNYIYFEANQRGLNFNAVIGITIIPWAPLRSYRGYVIGYIASEGVNSESELRAEFLRFLNSFKPVT